MTDLNVVLLLDAHAKDGGSAAMSSPVSDENNTSLRNHYGSNSLKNRFKLDLTPSHTKPADSGDATPQISTPEARALYEYVEYQDVDASQRVEFEKLLKKVSNALCHE